MRVQFMTRVDVCSESKLAAGEADTEKNNCAKANGNPYIRTDGHCCVRNNRGGRRDAHFEGCKLPKIRLVWLATCDSRCSCVTEEVSRRVMGGRHRCHLLVSAYIIPSEALSLSLS